MSPQILDTIDERKKNEQKQIMKIQITKIKNIKPEVHDGELVEREAHRHHQYRVQMGVDCHVVGEEL